jgi:hypothetical protein
MTDFKKIMKGKERAIDKEYQDRLVRCIPVAEKIIKMIAEEKLPIGELADKEGKIKEYVKERYENFAVKVLTLMLESDIRYSERTFLFQLVLQAFDKSREMVIMSIDRSFERAFEAKWKDELDITMRDIHEVLINIGK